MFTQMPRVGPRPSRSAEPTTGPHEDAERAGGRVEPDGAGQVGGADEVLQEELLGRCPQRPGHAVQDQQHARVPDGEGPGGEQDSPGERHDHEERLRPLDELAAVVAVGEGAEVGGEQQEGQPVADDLEAREGGGVEPLPDHPVGDDVLDVVGHHRQGGAAEVAAGVGVAQRRELGRLPRVSGPVVSGPVLAAPFTPVPAAPPRWGRRRGWARRRLRTWSRLQR